MDRLLDAMTLFSLALIVGVLATVRRAHIRVEYSVSWLLAGLVLLGLSRWGSGLEWLSRMLGASDAASGLLIVSGFVFLVVLFRMSLRISGLKDSNIALAQRVALLEYRLDSIHEKDQASQAG